MHYHFDDIETAKRFDAIMSGWEEPGSQRTKVILRMFRQGKNFEEIGYNFGITRERVRQIVLEHTGMTAADGPRARMREERRQADLIAKHERQKQRCMDRHGCTLEQKQRIPPEAFRKFHESKRNAKRISGREFAMTMWEWWCIWDESGLWGTRERKNYMRRIDRSLPYSRGNCFIKD